MAGKAGASGGARKGAGRPKGKLAKHNQKAAERLAELDCDPIEGMAIIAAESMEEARKQPEFKDKKDAYKLAGEMYKELAQYTQPKLRSVEVKGGGEPLQVVIDGKDARV